MSKNLTLSIVIPAEKMKRSLALSLVDADSHFYSMRYKSIEFVIVDDSDEDYVDELVKSLDGILPSVLKSSSEDLHESISGESVIVLNHESVVDYEILDNMSGFIKDDVSVGVLSFYDDGILSKITGFIVKILGFKRSIKAHEYPFAIFLRRDLVEHVPVFDSHKVVSYLDLIEEDIKVIKNDSFSEPGLVHYLKVWVHLFSIKIKEGWSNFVERVKNKINKNEQ